LGLRLPATAESREVGVALSNSFAFGGVNCTIVLGKLNDE